MTLTRQAVRVSTNGDDEEGCLLFANDRLVAVLVRLSGLHEELAGRWYLEAGFGRLDGPDQPTFAGIDAAERWIADRLSQTSHRVGGDRPGP